MSNLISGCPHAAVHHDWRKEMRLRIGSGPKSGHRSRRRSREAREVDIFSLKDQRRKDQRRKALLGLCAFARDLLGRKSFLEIEPGAELDNSRRVVDLRHTSEIVAVDVQSRGVSGVAVR